MEDPKPGLKTSELGFAGIVGALTVFNDKLADLSAEQLWALVILSVAYMITRALVKIGTQPRVDPDVKAMGELIRKVQK